MSFHFHPDVADGVFSRGGDERPIKEHVYEAVTDLEKDFAHTQGHVDVGQRGSDLHKALLAQTSQDEQGGPQEPLGSTPPLDFSAQDVEDFRAFMALKQDNAPVPTTDTQPKADNKPKGE